MADAVKAPVRVFHLPVPPSVSSNPELEWDRRLPSDWSVEPDDSRGRHLWRRFQACEPNRFKQRPDFIESIATNASLQRNHRSQPSSQTVVAHFPDLPTHWGLSYFTFLPTLWPRPNIMYYLECAHAPTGHIVNSVKADFVSDRHLTSVDYFPVLIVINGSNHRSSTLLILYTIGFSQSARSDELLSSLKRLRAVLSLDMSGWDDSDMGAFRPTEYSDVNFVKRTAQPIISLVVWHTFGVGWRPLRDAAWSCISVCSACMNVTSDWAKMSHTVFLSVWIILCAPNPIGRLHFLVTTTTTKAINAVWQAASWRLGFLCQLFSQT